MATAENEQAMDDILWHLKNERGLLKYERNQLKRILRQHTMDYEGINTFMLMKEIDTYPSVPRPMMSAPHKDDSTIPEISGVYFVWDATVIYVGKATNLRRRVNTYHEQIHTMNMVSWIEFPLHMIDYAECYYIGKCLPIRNFGKTGHARDMINGGENGCKLRPKMPRNRAEKGTSEGSQFGL